MVVIGTLEKQDVVKTRGSSFIQSFNTYLLSVPSAENEVINKADIKQIYFLLSLSIECSVRERSYANEHKITSWFKEHMGNVQGVEREVKKW